MKNTIVKAALVGFCMVFAGAGAMAADAVQGYWLTQNKRAVVHVAPCDGGSMCGRIHWIIDGGLQFDKFNEDEALRSRPICGLEILNDFDKEGAGDWEDGNIYKADDGDIYDADIEVEEDGRLKVRGYLGISMFGKTQYWTKVSANDYKQCSAP